MLDTELLIEIMTVRECSEIGHIEIECTVLFEIGKCISHVPLNIKEMFKHPLH